MSYSSSACFMVAWLAIAPIAAAQDRSGQPPRRPAEQTSERAAAASERLPADSITHHELKLPGRTLRYTATAGSLPLVDPKGKLLAEIAYVAYVLDGEPGERRPITFALNGGPGASSAYLHLGSLGPRRLPFGSQGDTPSDTPALVDNADTWLDFTDLVFIDPVGTGFSRFAEPSEDLRKQFWSVDGDARALSRTIAKYLARSGRLTSPKYLVGESYGGFRLPKIASLLQTSEGVGVSGLVMLSPVLDFSLLTDGPTKLLTTAALLPSMAAAKLEREGKLSADAMAAVERYASGDYLTDLVRGPRDKEAVARIVDRVSELTGLDRSLVERLGGRIDARTFAREFYRGSGRVGSSYDVLVSSPDPYPNDARTRYEDPILEAATAPLTSAAVDYLSRTLNWAPDARYNLLSEEVNRGWNWGGGLSPPEVLSDLRSALALDEKLKVLTVHGFTDLVTPYFESKLALAQLPQIGATDRVRFEVFPGGHMFYSRDGSRSRFREAVRRLYQPSTGEGGQRPNGTLRD
ncbi:S10 family peptidase [Chelatococcus reniformis]|uniref:Peptidase S10 n=1 Tax=Chelatococcus reniformis TaxID=1494448 RepID=A0A916UDN1_9HYPH|nr:peptidase S10 [Chelatococcus reniformis]GGC69163.1 peptidase S10 [Chelatococcus reniformis]